MESLDATSQPTEPSQEAAAPPAIFAGVPADQLERLLVDHELLTPARLRRALRALDKVSPREGPSLESLVLEKGWVDPAELRALRCSLTQVEVACEECELSERVWFGPASRSACQRCGTEVPLDLGGGSAERETVIAPQPGRASTGSEPADPGTTQSDSALAFCPDDVPVDHVLKRAVAAYRALQESDPTFAPHAANAFEVRETLWGWVSGDGVVAYRVLDRRYGREAIMKVLEGGCADSGVWRRFLRDVQVATKLDHPAIPPIYEAGVDARGYHYLLMRNVVGGPLSEELPRLGRLEALQDDARISELVELVIAVGQATAYAHSRGVIHHDLHPGNVVAGDLGRVAVVGWGRSRTSDTSSESTGGEGLVLDSTMRARIAEEGAAPFLGPPGYAAPEQARGEPTDERGDVFSLGALLCALLTGRPPVKGKSAHELLAAAAAGDIMTPGQRSPRVPGQLNAIAGRALAADPLERTATVAELVADLRAFQAGERVSAYDYSVWERAVRTLKRHAVLAGALVVLLGLLGLELVIHDAARRATSLGEELTRTRREHEADLKAIRALLADCAAPAGAPRLSRDDPLIASGRPELRWLRATALIRRPRPDWEAGRRVLAGAQPAYADLLSAWEARAGRLPKVSR